MKIVGSRTGQYEYWVELECGFKIWLGQRENSDSDILLSKNENVPNENWDIFYGEPFAPYVEDGRLVEFKNRNYLMFPLCVKLRARNLTHILFNNYMKVANVMDSNLKKVDEILLDYQIIPSAICCITAAQSRSKMLAAKPSA